METRSTGWSTGLNALPDCMGISSGEMPIGEEC